MQTRRLFIVALFVLTAATVYSQASPPCACCHEKAKQFHYWVGEWEVTNPKGKVAGTNRIVLMEGNCVMQENWTAAGGGYTGTSYNFYNTSTGKWQQLWIDNQGGNLQLEGEWNGSAMILQNKPTKNRQGQLQIDRITWTPNADGSVRQLWEVSTDGGAKWSVAFDGMYRRK
jgi:hypothetical protein